MASQDITPALGKVIRRHRKARELTQEQLGFAAEVSRIYISLVELGNSSPTISILGRIAGALGLPLSALILEAESVHQKRPFSSAARKTKR